MVDTGLVAGYPAVIFIERFIANPDCLRSQAKIIGHVNALAASFGNKTTRTLFHVTMKDIVVPCPVDLTTGYCRHIVLVEGFEH